ncbi:MAG TPA: hypothetical protein PK379_08870 [Candidatus Hydrogenedentes bacterium]|nr:hypothetical protein [Candidatus Hydrogenedentota bacterium]
MSRFWMTSLVAVVMLGVMGMPSAHGQADSGLKAGAAYRVVTPDPLLPVSGGMGEPRPVREKYGDLYARAVVLENNGVRIAFVSLDFLGWPGVLCDRIRQQVQGIPAENILIASTHTHSAPDPYGFPDLNGSHGADVNYLHKVCDLAAEAVNEAVNSLRPARLRLNVARAEGKIAYNYYAPQLYDPRCGVIQAREANGDKVIFTLVNYAIHPEVVGNSKGLLGPDLCGFLYDEIEKRAGGMAIFLNSAQGGMVTADNRTESGKDAETVEEAERIGRLLASEALRIIESAGDLENPALYCMARPITFPVDNPLMRAAILLSPLGMGQDTGDGSKYTTRLNLVNVGPAQILTIPGEALPNIGYYLKRNMPTRYPFLFGLTNDALGYILTKVDWMSFDRYQYVSETCLGEMTGELLIEALLNMVKDAPKPQ